MHWMRAMDPAGADPPPPNQKGEPAMPMPITHEARTCACGQLIEREMPEYVRWCFDCRVRDTWGTMRREMEDIAGVRVSASAGTRGIGGYRRTRSPWRGASPWEG